MFAVVPSLGYNGFRKGGVDHQRLHDNQRGGRPSRPVTAPGTGAVQAGAFSRSSTKRRALVPPCGRCPEINGRKGPEHFLPDETKYLTLEELCSHIGISAATGKNWMKLKKLTADGFRGGSPYFFRRFGRKPAAQATWGNLRRFKKPKEQKEHTGDLLL